jgi:hypothetical protein
LSSKEYKRIYEEEKRKIIEERNHSLKKNLFLDFNAIKFNVSDIIMLENASQNPPESSQTNIESFSGP